MRIMFWSIAIALVVALAAQAVAAPIVNLQHCYVAKNSSAPVAINVTDGGDSAAEDIEGMTFRLQIAAGIGAMPSIASVNFLTGAIWAGHVSPANVFQGAADPQYKSFSLITDNAGDFVNANGILATATVNTAGAGPGDYALKLTGTKNSEPDSQFIAGSGATVPATFTSGILTVVIAGDFNRDGQLTVADIQPMLVALTDLAVYENTFNVPPAELVAIGDLDGDGSVTNKDIQPLLDSVAATGGGSLAQVPEPPTIVLAAMLLAATGLWRLSVGK